ncbi:MAG: hypothetical protein K5840_07430 [Eubacterium sp.]|nr:hypothetical protein [Eubacterium sp.]
MKKFKKQLALLLVTVLTLTLTGCAKFTSAIEIAEDESVTLSQFLLVDKDVIDANSELLGLVAKDKTVIQTIDGTDYYDYSTLYDTNTNTYVNESDTFTSTSDSTLTEINSSPEYHVTTSSFYVASYSETSGENNGSYADLANMYIDSGFYGITEDKIAALEMKMVVIFPSGKTITSTNGTVSDTNPNQVAFDLYNSNTREGDSNIWEIYAYCSDAEATLAEDQAAFDAVNIANGTVTAKKSSYLPETEITEDDITVVMNGKTLSTSDYTVSSVEGNGQYSVYVYGQGDYTGSKTITVKSKKGTPTLSLSKKKVKKGKTTKIKVKTNSSGDIKIKAANKKTKAAIKSKKIKIKNSKIVVTKKAAKGTYKFKVTVKASTQYKKKVKTFKVKVK